MEKALQVIEDDILFIGHRLNDEFYERYSSGEITLKQLEEAYKSLSKWSVYSEILLKLLE